MFASSEPSWERELALLLKSLQKTARLVSEKLERDLEREEEAYQAIRRGSHAKCN